MAQKTNLNISPYFDDFAEKDTGAKDKNYYKVLFNPGRSIQARELNTLQSILQNQVETFGSHFFKEGSVVIPGNIVYDNQFHAVKLNSLQYGVDISKYLNNYIGKKITGQVSGITATIKLIEFSNSENDSPTIYVKYLNSDSNFEINSFQDNEELFADDNIVYGTTTIFAGSPFATTISSNATSIGSAVSIGEGVYFVRGLFVKVPQQTIILDSYTNTPSYRIGLRVDEKIITAKDDTSLSDNAKGFTNYAAPGADRFQISLVLSKKSLTDIVDVNFIELLRIENGAIQKVEVKSSYALIRDYLAQRTYDESGDYSIVPFQFTLNNSLNNRLGNDGAFFSNERTEMGNIPSDDLMCIKMSPGKAYVRGYDIEKTGIEILDVDKPREKQSAPLTSIPFEMGNLLRINNLSGAAKQKRVIYFQNSRKNSTVISAGSTIGSARIYTLNVTDAAYSNATTNWDLYLYDIQTYTRLVLNKSLSSTELPASSYIKGKSSGASGYAAFAGNNSDTILINQTSGNFSTGEQILINGIELYPRSISSIRSYSIEDIKSVHQPTSVSGFSTAFIADTQLEKVIRNETIQITSSGGISTARVNFPESFTGISTDNIIRYNRSGSTSEIYNKVVSISTSNTSMTLEAVPTVNGICDGSLSTSFTGSYTLGVPKIKNSQEGFLYTRIPDSNIASVDLNESILTFSAQSNSSFPAPVSNTITLNSSNFNLGINTGLVKFQSFDEERYSIFYSDGTIENLTPDKVIINPSLNQVTFSNISNKEISAVNATFIKNSIQSKVKKFVQSKTIEVNLSNIPQSGNGISTSINDGLIYNQFYGLRVQDEEICLRYPDVVNIIAVYESLDNNSPVLDQLTFNSTPNVDSNAIIGENIVGKVSNSIARIVSKVSTNTLGIVYLNNNVFSPGENVFFEKSNINTEILNIIFGRYSNITQKFALDKGQKEQYYDYSKIIRKTGEVAPAKRLLIVFDYYSIPESDSGDLFTVNSYENERFGSDIPILKNNVRATDTLDFRPRVPIFTGISSSPFDFSSRVFGDEPKVVVTPNESSLIGYEFYLGRIDQLYLDKSGSFVVNKGISSINPKAPDKPFDVMELATITLPPYLYNPKDARISIRDNRRYTMRDIGKIEDRVEDLEKVTSLSLLELKTQSLQFQDAQGLSRFKTGFFVDDFKNTDLIDSISTIEVDRTNEELITKVSRNSLSLKPVFFDDSTDENLDLSRDLPLFDSNVQKTGDLITLKYNSVEWITQGLATKTENVNPFHVVSYNGTVKLNPESDSWIRTIQLQDINVNKTSWVWLRDNGGRALIVDTQRTSSVKNNLLSSGIELYMRSRNTGFNIFNLKPLTRYYQFLDGNSGVDFIPKLIEIATDFSLENYGASSSFIVGEKVTGWLTSNSGDFIKCITFRVAKSNHREGPYNNPSATYSVNPYFASENISEFYSPSSKILNIDIDSLCAEAQGLYSGYLTVGMKLIGETSNSVAYVKNLRLISDFNGYLSGSFFLRDPNTNPPPSIRIATGSKVYKISSSSTNETSKAGSPLISSAETIYKSEGVWEQRQRTTTSTTTFYYVDPLAQSFTVGGVTEIDNGNVPNEDANGAYLTAVDLFFARKDPNNAPLTVEIRTVELGTPTRTILGKSVVLNPSDIVTSTNGTIPTKVTFDYPIYLAPGLQYAIVLLAPQSDKYEVWIAEMGEKTIQTANLPDSQAVRYSRQFAIGRLYKSQNGAEWSPNDYQDLKFKLYKARFTSTSGSVLLHNPTLDESNGFVSKLNSNSISIVPRKVKVGIATTTNSSVINILTPGKKISIQSATYNYGYIVSTGSSVSNVTILNSGTNYSNGTVSTYAINGNGTGLTLSLTTTNSAITSAAVVNPGNGYSVGDIVGIVTSTVSSTTGRNARITINQITGIDTLYLSNVQGSNFNVGISTLVYYDVNNQSQSISSIRVQSSVPFGGIYGGNYFKVNHFNHGMYSNINKLTLSNVKSNVIPTTLVDSLTDSSTFVSVASTEKFGVFEGIPVSGTNPGFIKIENEIIKYTTVNVGILEDIVRGVDSTKITDHDANSLVHKYELGGVSLRRINKTHDINDSNIDIDSYYIQFDRSNFDSSSNTTDRSNDQDVSEINILKNTPQLSFAEEISCGGSEIFATENIQFNSITPEIAIINPGSSTNVNGQIKTVSGTSVDGDEISFVEYPYESVELGTENRLNTPRIICSSINEQTYLTTLFRRKSFTLKLDLSTTNSNLSPGILWKDSSVRLNSNRLNRPIVDFSNDNRVNSILDDPHAAIYISNTVRLTQVATSLKVLISAYRHASADFRVLYSLIRPDSSEVNQSFELFPGYDNLTLDNNQDGYFDVIDLSKNSGLPDKMVPASLENQFLEYEFSANNLGTFTGYTIKIVMSGTNQAQSPRFQDLRSIALA